MAYNRIQLFALNVPDRMSIPFDLYALTVPLHWQELFNRLQQYKSGRSKVLPPIKCLNQYLQLLIEDLLFPNYKAFYLNDRDNRSKWLYAKSPEVDLDYIAAIVKVWADISFQASSERLTDRDIQEVKSLSGNDLKFEKVNLAEQVWKIENDKLVIVPLYYALIPYLFSSAICSAPLQLINPAFPDDRRIFDFRESILADSSSSEVITWMPECQAGKQEKHYYSYHVTFTLHYHPGGLPYLNCEYGKRRWVNWELGYLPTDVNVYFSPTGSQRFAPASLTYIRKKQEINFEGNLGFLMNALDHRDKFTIDEVIKSPYKTSPDRLNWMAVYGTQMSKSHYVNAGLLPPDIASFHQACIERIERQSYGAGFSPLSTYMRCDDSKDFKLALSQQNKLKEFNDLHSDRSSMDIPFSLPDNLRLLVLAQDRKTDSIVKKLATKYGIENFQTIALGQLGSEFSGINSDLERKQRIKEFQASPELKAVLSGASMDTKTLVILEIIPKSHFWKDAKKDPKPCFRPALAMLGCIAKCFESKVESSEIDLERRIEKTFLRGLAMTGAYLPPVFEAESKQFPPDVASVGVYAIPCYSETKRQFFPVAVRSDKNGVMAIGYGCSQWMNIYDFQIEMCRGNIFKPIESHEIASKVQHWVFNKLFEETQQPTIYCFDAINLRTKGLRFLQKQHWCRNSLAVTTDGDSPSFIPLSRYPDVRIASILTPESLEVPFYRACDESGDLEGHTKGVFYPADRDPDCGYYYLSNQKPSNRSGTLLQKSGLFSMAARSGDRKKPKPADQGYNPRGIFLTLTLQESDRASEWASFVQCRRLYGLIHHLDATTYPAELHLAEDLRDFLPVQALREG